MAVPESRRLRAGGYSARNPDKVGKLVLLAPAYNRNSPTDQPTAPDSRPAMGSQSRADFMNTWNAPQNCPGQREAVVGRQTTPLLAIAAANDASVNPARVRELYEDYGADEKILIDLGCASHSPMWEGVHGVLFAATLEWLRSGTVTGESTGVIRLGYPAE